MKVVDEMTKKKADILNEYFNGLGKKRYSIAREIGASSSHVGLLLSGKQRFTYKMAKRFNENYGLNISWLLMGAGEMFDDEAMNEKHKSLASQLKDVTPMQAVVPSSYQAPQCYTPAQEKPLDLITALKDQVEFLRQHNQTLLTIINNMITARDVDKKPVEERPAGNPPQEAN